VEKLVVQGIASFIDPENYLAVPSASGTHPDFAASRPTFRQKSGKLTANQCRSQSTE
jgi:hypothetical protein